MFNKTNFNLLVFPFVLFVVWAVLAELRIVSSIVLPKPETVMREFGSLLHDGQLLRHLSASLFRFFSGYMIGSTIGMVLGIMMGKLITAEYLFNLPAVIQRNIPPIAWIPIAILWFGLGNSSAIFIITLAAIPPALLNTFAGVRETRKVLYLAAMSLGAEKNSMQMFLRITLPAAFPFILTGLRISIGTAWTGIVAAEMIAAKSGLGYMMIWGQQTMATQQIILGILLIGLLGLCLDSAIAAITKRFDYWKSMEI